MEGENIDEIAQKSASLSQEMMKMGEAAYKNTPQEEKSDDKEGSEENKAKDEDVVDADFEEVDDQKDKK